MHDLTPSARFPASVASLDWTREVRFEPVTYPPPSHRIQRVCLIDRKAHPGVGEILEEETLATSVRVTIWAETQEETRTSSFRRPEEIITDLTRQLMRAIRQGAEGFAGQPLLLQRCRPLELHLSTEPEWLRERERGLFITEPTSYSFLRRSDRIVLHQSSSRPVRTLAALQATVTALRRVEPSPLEIRFVGMPWGVVDSFEQWSVSLPTDVKGKVVWDRTFDLDQTWSWDLPDGSLYTMHTKVSPLSATSDKLSASSKAESCWLIGLSLSLFAWLLQNLPTTTQTSSA